MNLYQALTEDRRKFYPLVAESPALAVNYCGNVAAEVFGLDRFEEYILPHYNELAEMLHERGKLLGVHFDANTRLFASAIAKIYLSVFATRFSGVSSPFNASFSFDHIS